MADRAAKVLSLISTLQAALEKEQPQEPFTFLAAHQGDVLELAELKGDAMVDQFLGFDAGTVDRWRKQPIVAEAKRQANERGKELAACWERLRQDLPSLQTMRPSQWLDLHHAEAVELLTSGIPFLRLAHDLGIVDTTLRQWCARHGVISPRSRGKRALPRIVKRRRKKPQAGTPLQVEKPPTDPHWGTLPSKELQQMVAQDILSMGQEAAYRLWMGRGMAGQHWASLLRMVRVRQLLPEPEETPTTASARAWYYQGKYEALRDLLLTWGPYIVAQPAPEGGDDEHQSVN